MQLKIEAEVQTLLKSAHLLVKHAKSLLLSHPCAKPAPKSFAAAFCSQTLTGSNPSVVVISEGMSWHDARRKILYDWCLYIACGRLSGSCCSGLFPFVPLAFSNCFVDLMCVMCHFIAQVSAPDGVVLATGCPITKNLVDSAISAIAIHGKQYPKRR